MATIPLQLAQRRLDTGNAVQYPQGSPIGGAMQGLGSELAAVAERFQQRKEQQEAFDAEIARRKMMDQIAQAEADVAANAAPDGAGLHDAMYGQVDPRSSQVVKPGLFDTLFDDALPKIPESQRANFARQKEALRAAGSERMAARQVQHRQQYEQGQWSEVQRAELDAIAQSDPNDTLAFNAARQRGLDVLNKMGFDPRGKLQAEAAWRESTARTWIEALVAQNPKRVAEMLSAGPVASDGLGEVVRMQLASRQGKQAAAKGDHIGKLTPDERVAQAFGGGRSAPNQKATDPTTDLRSDLSPDHIQRLVSQAHAATAAQLIAARTNIDLASQNAPDAIANTGTYSGAIPGPEDFAAVYGAEDGHEQYQDFARKIEVGRQAFGMRAMPNQAIHAALRDTEPGPGTSQEDQIQYQLAAAAALKTLDIRRADPAGYVREVFPNVDAAWREASKSEDYQAAIIISASAQSQLGIKDIQPLPNSIAEDAVREMVNKRALSDNKDFDINRTFGEIKDPMLRLSLTNQLIYKSASIAIGNK